MKVSIEAAKSLFKAMGFSEAAVDGWTDETLTKKLNLLPQKYEKGKNDPKDKASKKLLKDILSAIEDDEEEVTLDKKAGKPAKGKDAKKAKKSKSDDDEDEEGEEEAVEDEDEDSEDEDEDESDDDEDEESDDDEDEEEEVSEKKSKKTGKKDKVSKNGKPGKKSKDKDEKKSKKKGKKDKTAFSSAGGNGRPGITEVIKEYIQKATKNKPLNIEKMCDILEKKFPDRERKSMRVTVYSQLAFKLPKQQGWPIKKDDGNFWMTGNPPKSKK